jgi:hypothetical protein
VQVLEPARGTKRVLRRDDSSTCMWHGCGQLEASSLSPVGSHGGKVSDLKHCEPPLEPQPIVLVLPLTRNSSCQCSMRTMEDPATITIQVSRILQIYQRAIDGSLADDREWQEMIGKYSLMMGVLGDCAGSIQMFGDKASQDRTLMEATRQCAVLGKNVARRSSKHDVNNTTLPTYVLSTIEQLRQGYADFRSSVLLLHSLIQGYDQIPEL